MAPKRGPLPQSLEAPAIEAWLQRMPKVAKKTSRQQRENQMAEEVMFGNVVKALLNRRGEIAPTWAFLEKRKTALALNDRVGHDTDTFDDLGTLQSLDLEFAGAWVLKNSDFTEKDMGKMVAKDGASPLTLIAYAVQVSLKARLPEELKVKEVLKLFLDARNEVCGRRLRRLKANGGMLADGALDYTKLTMYTLSFDDVGLLTGISHGRDKAVVDSKFGLNNKWKLDSVSDDFGAALLCEPLPPVKCTTFFREALKEGPFSIPNFIGKPKELADEAKKLLKEWMEGKQAKSDATQASGALKTELDKSKKTKQRDQMATARAAAAKKLAEKKTLSQISLCQAPA